MSTLSHGLQLLKKYYEIMVGDREKIASLTIPPPVISVIFYEESSGSFLRPGNLLLNEFLLAWPIILFFKKILVDDREEMTAWLREVSCLLINRQAVPFLLYLFYTWRMNRGRYE